MQRFATSCLLVVALTVAVTFAIPASYEREKDSDTSEDAEFIVVPLSHQRPTYFNRYPSSSFDGFDGVVDTGDFATIPARPVYFPSYNPFSWHLSGYLDDLMKRVRDRFAGSWNPFYGGDFIPSGPGVWPVDIPEDSSEDGATNSTSTVKVIDGHKVVINDTYYTKKTDFGTSIFKVRVIDVKPVDEAPAGEAPKPEAPTETELGNRNGEDDDNGKEPTPTTDAPKRDTELESSDEEKTTADDDNLNTIDTSNVDIDEAKESKEKEALTDKSESSVQWAGLESFEGASGDSFWHLEETLARQLNRANSELLDSSSEEDMHAESKGPRSPLSDEWPGDDSRKRIIVPTSQFDHRFNANQERPASEEGTGSPMYDLTNDININFRLATDRSVTVNPNAVTFDPTAKPPTGVVVQRDPFPAGPAGVFPGANGRPTVGFPSQQPGGNGNGGPVFPMVGPFPGFNPGGQFPVQPFPMQPPLFAVPIGPTAGGGRPNFGFAQSPQVPPFFFGNGQFGRP